MIAALFGRVWGWLLAGLGVFAFLKYRENRAAKEACDEIAAQQQIADATAVTGRAASDDVVRRDGADAARDELRKDWRL
jgi:hypothetical protein